ncbi:receptor-like serine/threonine-protein kinase At4g25390 [Gastrolobium bilobum]|uniref:receptor-like serine/threonine-protein kinase At4g25390 n=1 Tax=Gastrolobium bilobum TaxID=150636 RepID=UPI002AAFA5B7|nr:receptor-like serine/threonine-protein kinase At4g25390 [Gastrolobium bilobum]
MPSRQLSTSSPAHNHRQSHHVLTPLLASTASACSIFLLVLLCLRKRKQKRTTPSSDSDSNPPHPFSYALLRRATNSFSTCLGHGGFGPVFSGSLPPAGKPVAVKLMDSASLQGEREFHNELFFASRLRSDLVVPAIGFSSDPKHRRFLLVYDLMHNGNLHDALLRRKCPELTQWKNRFAIVVDIARGIRYLHSCDPPVIHGDIKPSNILLDSCFSAKIGDFGLARLKTESQFEVESEKKRKEELESDGTESVNTGFEEQSFEHVGEIDVAVKTNEVAASGSGLVNNGRVKDYVMDWIGKEVSKETPKGERVIGESASSMGTVEKKKSRKKLEWWESMDEEKGGTGVLKMEKRRPAREWWKDEYSDEIAKKKKKKKKQKQRKRKGENSDDNGDDWWERDDSNKNRNRSVDSWFSGELRRPRRNSYDSGSGEIHKSGGMSSTPSMRGTIFYVAPEYNGYSGDVSDKCDVYSFGVLLLVIISGRRPLQVTGSPLSEFKRANLVSWARHCGRNGKLLELVDQSIQSLDKEEALLCIRVALLCLLKSPARRPSMKEVVGMLTGELESPQLPVEYTNTSSRFPFKPQKECPSVPVIN